MKNSNQQLVRRISRGDKTAFKQLFFDHYYGLCSVAEQITKSSDQARDVVQEVFLKIWRTHTEFSVNVSLKAYLYRSVRNQALNFREKQRAQERIKKNFADTIGGPLDDFQIDSQAGDQSKIVAKVWELVQTMPNRRKMAFSLHRQHGLTYKEISDVMDISQKTVEYHIGAALKEIRSKIKLGNIVPLTGFDH